MYRSFSLVVVLLLCCTSGFIVNAQTSASKVQPQVETKRSQVATSPSSTTRPDQTENAKKAYRQGLNFLDAGELLPAAENFRQAIQFDPEYADAYSALGRTYFKLQEWQKAFDTLKRAADLNRKPREVSEPKRVEASVVLQNTDSSTPKSTIASVPPPNLRVEKKTLPIQTNNSSTLKQLPPSLQNAPALKPTTTQAQPNHAAQLIRPNLNSEPDSKKQSLTGNSVAKVSVTPKVIKIALAPPVIAAVAVGDIALGPVLSFQPTQVSVVSEEPPVPEQVAVAVGTQVSQPATTASPINANEVTATLTNSPAEVSPTKIYRVGPSDVLDVRLNSGSPQQSTLYTITPAGLLEHPMLAEPMLVSGLTVEEIGAQIEKDLVKRAIAENPKAVVGVRDYASHSVLVSGLVKESGTKYLRREGIPLYVVIADAQPMPEAARVTVVRVDNQIREIDLDDAAEMNFLVRSGDVITLSPATTQFVYIGGEIKVPGEKTFRRGLTLLQVVLASGGLSSKARFAEIARVNEKGFLVPTRFQLKDIVSGNAVDPILKPGDRISILH